MPFVHQVFAVCMDGAQLVAIERLSSFGESPLGRADRERADELFRLIECSPVDGVSLRHATTLPVVPVDVADSEQSERP